MTTPVTVTKFRTDMPAFSSTTDYPDAAVQFRLDLADDFLDGYAFGSERTFSHAVELYTAHYLTVYGSKAIGGTGGAGGVSLGAVASKSVDGASVSYDNSAYSEEGAGFFNSTPYGRELWSLLRQFGAGGFQL